MGLFAGISALSNRILAIGTIFIGVATFGQWGVVAPVALVGAGVFYWAFAGYRHQQSFIRRGIVGGIWLLTTMFAIGHGVGT